MLRKALMKAVWAGNPLCKCLLEIVKQTLQRLWIQNSVQWCKQCSLSESSSFLKTGLSFFIPFFRSAKVWHSWVSFQMTYCPISSVSYNFKFSNFSHQTAKKVDSICPPVQRINLKSESTFCPQGTGKKKKKKERLFVKAEILLWTILVPHIRNWKLKPAYLYQPAAVEPWSLTTSIDRYIKSKYRAVLHSSVLLRETGRSSQVRSNAIYYTIVKFIRDWHDAMGFQNLTKPISTISDNTQSVVIESTEGTGCISLDFRRW